MSGHTSVEINTHRFLDVEPLAIVLQEELVASRGVLESKAEHGTRSVNSHSGGSLVAPGDSRQLVTRPDSEDGSDREVGVDDGRSVQRVERHAESRATEVQGLRDLLGASELAASRVAEGLEQQLVGKQVDGELLVSEGVDAGGGTARGSPHLEGNGPDGLRHGHHHLPQLGIARGLHQELLEGVTDLGVDLNGSPDSLPLGGHRSLGGGRGQGLGVSEERGPVLQTGVATGGGSESVSGCVDEWASGWRADTRAGPEPDTPQTAPISPRAIHIMHECGARARIRPSRKQPGGANAQDKKEPANLQGRATSSTARRRRRDHLGRWSPDATYQGRIAPMEPAGPWNRRLGNGNVPGKRSSWQRPRGQRPS